MKNLITYAMSENAINTIVNETENENMKRTIFNKTVYDRIYDDKKYVIHFNVKIETTDIYNPLEREIAFDKYVNNSDKPLDNAVLDENTLYAIHEIIERDNNNNPIERKAKIYNALFDRNILSEICYIANKYQLSKEIISSLFENTYSESENDTLSGMNDDEKVKLYKDIYNLVSSIQVYAENAINLVKAYKKHDDSLYGILLMRLATRLTVSRLKKINSVGNDISNLVYSANDCINGERIYNAIQSITKQVYDEDGKYIGITYQYENGESATTEHENLFKLYQNLYHDNGCDLTQTCALSIHKAILFADAHNILTSDFLLTEMLCLDRRSLSRKDGKRNYTLKTPIQSAVSNVSKSLYHEKKSYTNRNIDTEVIKIHDDITDCDISHTVNHTISSLSDNYKDDERIKDLLRKALPNKTEYAVFYSHYQKLMSITDIALKLHTTNDEIKEIIKSAKRHLSKSEIISKLTNNIDAIKNNDIKRNGEITKAITLYEVNITNDDKVNVIIHSFKSISETALYLNVSRQAVIKAVKRHKDFDIGQLERAVTAEILLKSAICEKYLVKEVEVK